MGSVNVRRKVAEASSRSLGCEPSSATRAKRAIRRAELEVVAQIEDLFALEALTSSALRFVSRHTMGGFEHSSSKLHKSLECFRHFMRAENLEPISCFIKRPSDGKVSGKILLFWDRETSGNFKSSLESSEGRTKRKERTERKHFNIL
jgi:hypothetical protein